MPGIPEDVTLKLKHATRHLQVLNAQFADFGDREPYSDVGQLELDTPRNFGEYVMYMQVNRAPLPRWGLTIGDCLHNLRSALDCATLALWRAHSGEPSRKEIDGAMFPIYTTQKGFRLGRARKIGPPGHGLHPDAKRIIRLAQPYQRRDDPDAHYLAVLQALNNIDKHRLIHTTHAVMEGVPIIERQHNIEITYNSGVRSGGFDDGDPILHLRFRATGPKPELSVKLRSTYGVAFDKKGPARGQLVANLLNEIRVYIRDTLLPSLEPYF